MSKFLLTAQLKLQAPTNTRQVVSQMRKQLQGVNVNVNVKNGAAAQKQIQGINNKVKTLNSSGQALGKTFGVAVKRFAAFSVASRAVTLFTTGLADATREAITFERELVKISQVTGKTLEQLNGLNNTITKLSVGLGTSSKDLLATTRILAQAGIQAQDLDVALTALAKTTLAPTFEDITKTAEGAVAILAQFGQGVGALERQLGSINAVAGQFAVESGDLISVVRRTGGVFKAAGGELEELIALFTSVRATTRESAESIATGLRTIFTRIQRPATIEFLKQFGVELVNLNGKFVGPYEAIKQLSQALSGLGEGDIRFVQIAEELGGFRQIGKVIPLLQQFETAERARQAALEGGDSLTKDAATAQQALAVQITKVKEEFLALVRGLSQTTTFQTFLKTSLDLASALIKVADALKPILPLMAAFAGFKIARGIVGFGKGLGAGLRGFNTGGVVPGTGNRDTVPAMLTPGEFVIRKSSVKKIGAANLAAMNAKGYNAGGIVREAAPSSLKSFESQSRVIKRRINPVGNINDKKVQFNSRDRFKSRIIDDYLPTRIPTGFSKEGQRVTPRQFEKLAALRFVKSKAAVAKAGVGSTDPIDLPKTFDNIPTEVKRTKTPVTAGTLIDKLIRAITKKDVANTGGRSQLTGKPDQLQLRSMRVVYGNDQAPITASDARAIGIAKKKKRKGRGGRFFGGSIPKYATGGPAPSDTVPALLTPGEFVINAKSASKIGKANLDRMNKKGVAGFAAGGLVGGVKRFSLAGAVGRAGQQTFASAASSSAKLPTPAAIPDQGIFKRLEARLRIATKTWERSDKEVKSLTKGTKEYGDALIKRKSTRKALEKAEADYQKALQKENSRNTKKPITKTAQSETLPQGSSRSPMTARQQAAAKQKATIITPEPYDRRTPAEARKQAAAKQRKSDPSTIRQNQLQSNMNRQTSAMNQQMSNFFGKAVQLQNQQGQAQKKTTSITQRAGDVLRKSFDSIKNAGSNLAKKFTAAGQAAAKFQAKAKAVGVTRDPATGRLTRGADFKSGKGERNRRTAKGKGGGGGAGIGAFFAIEAFAAMIPQVEGATQGLGAVQNALGPVISQAGMLVIALSSMGLKANSLAGRFAYAGLAVYGAAKLIDAYTGVHEKAKKAVEEGNIGAAGGAAVASGRATVGTGLATAVGGIAGAGLGALGAAIGTVILPGIGTAIGGALGTALGVLAGILTKVISSMEAFQPVLDFIRDNLLVLFGADSTAMVKEKAEADAAAAKASKELADNAKKASDALKEVELGNQTLQQAFDSGDLTADIKNRQRVVAERNDTVNLAIRERGVAQRRKENLDKTFGDTSLKGIGKGALAGAAIGTLGVNPAGAAGGALIGASVKIFGRVMKSLGDNTKAAGEKVVEEMKKRIEAEKALRDAQLKLLPQIIQLGRKSFVAGNSLEDFKTQSAKNLGIESGDFGALDPEVQAKVLRAYVNNIKAIAENTAAFAASTMGLRPIRTFAQGLDATLSRTSSVLDGNFNSLASSVSIVEAALGGAQVSSEVFNRSLGEVNSTLTSFGVSSKTIDKMNSTFSAMRTATAGFNSVLQDVGDQVIAGDLSGGQVKDKIIEGLTNLEGIDEEGKKAIRAIFGTIKVTDADVQAIGEGNFDSILSQLDEAGKKAFEETDAASKSLISAENQLVGIMQKRAQAEQKYIDAQKKSIDLEEYASDARAKAAGKELSRSEKEDFETRRLSASLGGGTGSRGTSAGLINRVGEIRASAAGATGRIAGVAAGGAGDTRQVAQDQESLAKASKELDSIAEYAKKRIKLYQDELDIVQKKNALEKSSLEKLVSGDTLGFIKAQEAAAAQSALLRGDTSAASQFSSSAQAEALKNLDGQGLSDSQRRTAAATALGPAFASQRNIGLLSGVSGEESALRQGINEQADVLDATAGGVKQVGKAELEIASAALLASNQAFVTAQQQAAIASANFAKTMERAEQAAASQAGLSSAQAQEAEGQLKEAEESARKKREAEKKLSQADVDDVRITAQGQVVVGGKEVQAKARGGMVYASRGMFIPRGTDTVPAMLTPGEFVVNRAAVQRGNNLQVLKAMNNNSSAPAEGMSRGGTVYRRWGSKNPETATGGGMDMSQVFKTFESSSKMFSDAVNKLVGFKLNIQLDPANVNVNINGGTFLQNMKENLKEELLGIISERIKNANQDFTGDINMDPYTQRIV